jgi:anti-sigma regulatory factor (Ser/Thr protein kinase)
VTAAVTDEIAGTGFEHEAFFYRGEAGFLTGLLPFLREGLDRGEAVVVAEPRHRLELLRDALGEDAEAVEWLDMAEIGANPARIIGVWAAALDRHTAAGRTVRGVGEPAFAGRRDTELVECRLHELLLNVAFDDGPGWRLLCPYDVDGLPRSVSRDAVLTHPLHSTGAGRLASERYAPDGYREAFAAPLPAPAGSVFRGRYGAGDVPATRRTVAHYARSCGVPQERVEVLELAASELATNSVRHGGGSGSLAMWLEPGAVVVEFSDAGRLLDPLTGRLTPSLDQEGGRGLYLVNQLCDLVAVRSSDHGTTVRVTTWL